MKPTVNKKNGANVGDGTPAGATTAKAAQGAKLRQGSKGYVRISGLRVFYVEDSHESSIMAELLLERLGVIIGMDHWGSDIVKKLDSFGNVDVLLLDLNLHGDRSGIDIYKEVRACDRYRDLPVILVTAQDRDSLLVELRKLGFSGIIVKPINYLRFGQQISRILSSDEFLYVDSTGN